MSGDKSAFGDPKGWLKATVPTWYPLIRAGGFAVMGLGLWIATIGLGIAATLPGSNSLPWPAIIAGFLAAGLALVVVGMVLAFRWYRSYRTGRKATPAE